MLNDSESQIAQLRMRKNEGDNALLPMLDRWSDGPVIAENDTFVLI